MADASWTPVVRDKIWEKTVDTVGGVATFDLGKEDVQVGRYELTTVGGALQQKSVYFQAIDAATALRSGLTRDNTNYNTMYGFSSMVNKSVLELYSRTAAGVETKLASSYLENASGGLDLRIRRGAQDRHSQRRFHHEKTADGGDARLHLRGSRSVRPPRTSW